jgi:hypothetical protein
MLLFDGLGAAPVVLLTNSISRLLPGSAGAPFVELLPPSRTMSISSEPAAALPLLPAPAAP